MSIWSKISNFLRALLGLEKDVDRIMRPFVKVTTELQQFAEKQAREAAKDEQLAAQLASRAQDRVTQAERAKGLATNVGGLL